MDVIKTDKCEHTTHQTFVFGEDIHTFFSPDVYLESELHGKELLACSVCHDIVAACRPGTWFNGIPVEV